MHSVIPRWISGLAAVLTLLAISPAQGQAPQSRKFSVVANDCRFTPARFEVDHYDAVTITFSAEDQPHSFVIDAYRIAKRASPGGSVTFEFLADRKGTFPYYSNLFADRICDNMRGEFIVH